MAQIPESFVHYLAAWNERDPERIRRHLDLSVAPDVVFADPANITVGIDALEQLIRRALWTELPGAEFRRTSGVDGGHDLRYRYHWEVWVDGAGAAVGMDCTTVDEGGRILRLDGFFGDLPPFEG